MKDIDEPNVAIPPTGDSNSYFAPISPAANTMHAKPINDLVELLHRNSVGGGVGGVMKSGMGKFFFCFFFGGGV